MLILDEPTQGVDVGAKAEIHALMQELADAGMAVVMISSELPEISAMSDRMAVMRARDDRGVLIAREASADRAGAGARGDTASACDLSCAAAKRAVALSRSRALGAGLAVAAPAYFAARQPARPASRRTSPVLIVAARRHARHPHR